MIRKMEAGEKPIIWTGNENYGANCDNLHMLITELSETAEVGPDSVDPVDINDVSESHSQPMSIEELYDLAQQLTEEQKEVEYEEDCGTKAMQLKDLTDILSAVDVAAEKLCVCDIELEWERTCTVKRSIRAMLHHYYKILEEKKKKSKQLTSTFFLDVF